MGTDPFFAYGVADSLFKLGADLESLFILVHTLGGGADPGVPQVYVKGVGKTRISKNVVFYSVILGKAGVYHLGVPQVYLKGVGETRISRNVVFYIVFWARLGCNDRYRNHVLYWIHDRGIM